MSSTLAVVIGSILILVGVVGLLFYRRSRQSSTLKYPPPPVSVRTPEQELNDLGILEIRPKSRPRQVGPEKENIEEEEEDIEVIEVEVEQMTPEEESLHSGTVGNEGRARTADPDEAPEEEDITEKESSEEASIISEISNEESEQYERAGVSRREALFRLLNAIQASVDGYTASLIKQDANGKIEVEAIVSQNPQAIDVDRSILDTTVIDLSRASDAAVVVLDVGAADVPVTAIDYYRQPVDIRQLAIARVKIPDNNEVYYLLIDALAWQDLDDPWQRLMIGQFANFLGTFMATPQLDGRGNLSKPRIRPRREIIEEEMSRARSDDHPLALALVYLKQAEYIASQGPKAVGEAERAMESFLERALKGVRVERFGELTYGVFHEDEVSEVEAWALRLQEEAVIEESYYFEKGISIGIALLQDRHQTADDLRDDATEALRESFETGACTIIE